MSNESDAKTKVRKRKKASEKELCADSKCPIHGSLSVRGRSFEGKLTAARMQRTATFERERRHYIPKYQRYEKRRTVLNVHNPACISAKAGDKVRITECRPLSKTKKFVIVEKITE